MLFTLGVLVVTLASTFSFTSSNLRYDSPLDFFKLTKDKDKSSYGGKLHLFLIKNYIQNWKKTSWSSGNHYFNFTYYIFYLY